MYYYRKSKKLNIRKRTVDVLFTISSQKDDMIFQGVTKAVGQAETLFDFAKVFDGESAASLIVNVPQRDLDALLSFLADKLTAVEIWSPVDDLSVLEKCKKVRFVTAVRAEELRTLWNTRCNPELEEIKAYHCVKLQDISGLYGCTATAVTLSGKFLAYASDTDAPIVDDLSPFASMPNLTELELFIGKRKQKRADLLLLAALTGLQSLQLTKNFFTFRQFAWLKAKLPNADGVGCVYRYKYDKRKEVDCYVIAGDGMPDWLEDGTGEEIKRYEEEFNGYVAEFASAPTPPDD